EHVQIARIRVLLDRLGNAVCAEDGDGAGRNFAEVLDEARSLRAQRIDDMSVVHDLVPHVHGRAELRERLLDDIDGADHTGTKSSWLREKNAHAANSSGRAGFASAPARTYDRAFARGGQDRRPGRTRLPGMCP